MAASQGKVEAANKLEDPMAMLEPFKKFERNGLSLTIECKRVTDLDMDTIEWAFDLTKKNMQALYESCDFGWKDRDKKEEMTEEKAWYLIVRDQEKKPVAFIHFRFDIEIDVEVVYCYEIQLIEGVRRKGLGKFLMQILELMAYKTEMKKVMMTTFKHNTDSVDFFKKGLKYEVDEISPDDPVFDEGYCYWILSKTLQPKKSSATNSHGASGSVGNVTNGHCHSEGCCC
ncbi:hypothetical protein CHS0354_020414 [Potamilus streckersoni]|uniref:N-alpha-acetyltransferase 40 n=1 Tax=Potamilus streckersoni TaxID=2493646 RepID=A0AAE0SUV6_9BIVA|nr:hypothetical protein CHS0354_020414 [Potamilus streckersoni]